ncbi:MAG TPA: ABC transporter ATP-binding protein [Alphaproteobacteria bacterium]|nr:ABC transporter ATP-binding protein [Alphaproteobacteria bacterium]
MSEAATAALIELSAVRKRFERRPDVAERLLALAGRPIERRVVRAVDGVDLAIHRGEVVGLVGESGCGKSTLGRMAAGILAPTAGEIRYRGRAVTNLPPPDRMSYVLGVQMIFQDPYASLNPRHPVRRIVGEALHVHRLAPSREIPERVDRALEEVGLDRSYRSRYPHQFSGGQRQRIGIARALAVEPEMLVCDEPVAALDVSIQAQIINLFMDLRERRGLTYLFISHDLGLVRHISDRVAIMYLGRIVEMSPAAELFASPNHPYTQALLAEIPSVGRRRRTFRPIQGEIPSPLNPPSGCAFHPRCPHAMPLCRTEAPPLAAIAPGRISACHLNDAT